MKKKLDWFVVLVGGRLVDCLKAKDLVTAFDEAVDKWSNALVRSTKEGVERIIEVAPMPPRVPKVVIAATKEEIGYYGVQADTEGQKYGWPWPVGQFAAEL